MHPHDDTVSTEQPSHTQQAPAKAKRQLNSNKSVDHAWTATQKSGAVTSPIAISCYLTVSLTLVSLSLAAWQHCNCPRDMQKAF